MLYEFKLIVEAKKKICSVKSRDAIDHSRITKWLKTLRSGCKNIDDQAKSVRPKAVDS